MYRTSPVLEKTITYLNMASSLGAYGVSVDSASGASLPAVVCGGRFPGLFILFHKVFSADPTVDVLPGQILVVGSLSFRIDPVIHWELFQQSGPRIPVKELAPSIKSAASFMSSKKQL